MTIRHLCVLLAVTALLTACGDQQERLADDSTPASGPNAAQLDEACPAEVDAVLTGQATGTTVAADAVRARLCRHPLDGAADTEPLQLTGQQAAELSARYAGLEAASTDLVCTADAGPTVTLLFAYADSSAVAVATELFGCGTSRAVSGQEPGLVGDAQLTQDLRGLAFP